MLTTLLNQQLQGRTCYISRIKNHGYAIDSHPFSTFHSIVYKILRLTSVGHNLNQFHNKLAGEEMKILVESALTQLLHSIPSEEQLDLYYIALRQHLNGQKDITAIPNGAAFLHLYQQLKLKRLDWEESMQLATYYLENNHVDKISNFEFDNLILLRPELLHYSSNQNALRFVQALYNWNATHNTYNIYIQNLNGLHRISSAESLSPQVVKMYVPAYQFL